LPQGDDRKEADEADDDDGRFKDARGDIAKGDALACRLTMGNSTTAVAIPAMAVTISKNAPNCTRVSAPPPVM
jgi:hypothetical protein